MKNVHRQMRWSRLIWICALGAGLSTGLAACVGGPAARPVVASYDLGGIASKDPAVSWLGAVDVTAPSWLDSRVMQYRLEAEPARRQAFAENRWAATPAELLAAALRRQLGAGSGGCRLKVDLDEWIQTFDAAGQSRALVAARVGLYAPKGEAALARLTFQRELPAGRDPRQGVSAFAALEQQLAADLEQWLIAQDKAQKDLAVRCRP